MLLFYRDETIQNLASSVEKGSTPAERQKLFGACTEKNYYQSLVSSATCTMLLLLWSACLGFVAWSL